MERKEQGTVQALERGLKILELLMQEKRPMGVNEIAKCQGITPSAAYRILKTLEANGWSFQMSDDKYIPGEKLSYITEKNNFHLALAEVAYPIMQELTAREILPMNLVVRQDRRFFILQQTRTERYVDFVAPVGSTLPLHASAGGKILLCELPEVLRAQFLDGISFESMTPNTICTTVRITESMMKMARLAKMRRPMRLNMAIFFLLGVHPDALKIAAAASSLFSWPQQRDAPRMSEVL